MQGLVCHKIEHLAQLSYRSDSTGIINLVGGDNGDISYVTPSVFFIVMCRAHV